MINLVKLYIVTEIISKYLEVGIQEIISYISSKPMKINSI